LYHCTVAHPEYDVELIIYELALMLDMTLMVEGFIGYAEDFLRLYDKNGDLGISPCLFNQDVLENFFGQVRSRMRAHTNPSQLQYGYAVQKIVVAANASTTTVTRGGNASTSKKRRVAATYSAPLKSAALTTTKTIKKSKSK
jgi:hypothetical protein